MLFYVWIAGTIYSNFLNEPWETYNFGVCKFHSLLMFWFFFFFFDSFYILKL